MSINIITKMPRVVGLHAVSLAPALVPVLLGVACLPTETTPTPPSLPQVDEDPTENPIRGLPPELQRAFDDGNNGFEARFFPAQGLGPLYIRNSCAACHADDGKGPGFVVKAVVVAADGHATAATPFGPTLRPFFTAPATQPLQVADDVAGVFESSRVGPAVFGRGYIEAVRDDEIERVEAEQADGEDGVTGRIHRVRYNSKANPDSTFHQHTEGEEGLIGRFGLKARVATVDEFAADAYQGDMGITSPLRPGELPNPDGVTDDAKAGVDIDVDTVNATAAYMRLLEIPARAHLDDDDGRALFAAVGCNRCHVESLRTRADHPVPALQDIDAPIFSDLLLHDMGDGLADHVVDGDADTGASGREWKTAPLIGLRFNRGFLHDSRAATVDEAIDAHASAGSEANVSVDRFHALSDDDRRALVTWVEGL